jgi:large subunit ribosomal protein L18
MLNRVSRDQHRLKIHRRLRQRLQGLAMRPRLSVYRSLKHIYAQVIDDQKGATLASASSNEKAGPVKGGGNVAGAAEVGKLVAGRAMAKGIKQVVFDRGGYRYHGRVKALAEAARKAGLEF